MQKSKKEMPVYTQTESKLLKDFSTSFEMGLSEKEAELRLSLYGKNRIVKKASKGVFEILINQFKSPIVGLLFTAAALSFYFSEWLDGSAILVVILINAIIGFYMEFQALKSMNALEKMISIRSKVKRDGKLIELESENIVPGDIVSIKTGDLIPADGRLLECNNLQIDEAALTGESIPVEKQVITLAQDTDLAERQNMLFSGTFSTKGNGLYLVTETGMKTELGKIANLVQHADQSVSPLEIKLEAFSKKLIAITLVLIVIIFTVGIFNGHSIYQMLETAIALAVATIPEGLPIVATMALAKGMINLANHNVLVKKLSSVETLGGTNIICTDKTGTLTQNKIKVSEIISTTENKDILLKICALCNTAEIRNENNNLSEIGDPLEIGLLKYTSEHDYNFVQARKDFPKIAEIPFSSETKYMATVHKESNGIAVYVKGATEVLITTCKYISTPTGIIELTEDLKNEWLNKAEQLANKGLRVISGAYKTTADFHEEYTTDLIFFCLFGLIDPPRPEVFQAIKECKEAGIEVKMITGDHPKTALAIAKELNITTHDHFVLGKTMNISDAHEWNKSSVFARVSPKNKLDLIAELQRNKNIVGMTGDGVNDAPALKKADIGIAMGIRGTQVSQDAADMILKDDSFTSIVKAIKEGRIIFDNIRKFVIFLLSCNLSELFVIAVVSLLNLHYQLFPIQILFINLITDVFPALALGVTKGSKDIMKNKPRSIDEPIIDTKRWKAIFVYALVISSVSLVTIFLTHTLFHHQLHWNDSVCNNILFFTIISSQLLHVFNMGSDPSFLKSEVTKNKFTWYSVLFTISLIGFLLSFTMVREALHVSSMTVFEWSICVGAGVVSLLIIQLCKVLGLVKQ